MSAALDLEELIAEVKKGKRFKYLYFWGHRPRPDGKLSGSCFSQWWSSSFVLKGVLYPFAEHYMMAEKASLFGDEKTRDRILVAKSPGEAKRLGREVRGFDEAVWKKNRFDIVLRASEAKFGQNSDLKGYLLGTGNRVLVEASPKDRIWGIGLTKDDPRAKTPELWNGLNLLGFALMEARRRLREDASD